MTDKPIPFPQHKTRATEATKRRVAAILDLPASQQDKFQTLVQEFSGMTRQEIAAVVSEVAEEAAADVERIEQEYRVADEMRELRQKAAEQTGDENIWTSAALKLLAQDGDEFAQAALAQLTGVAAQFEREILDIAVEDDPYWEKLDNGSYRHQEGALYETPEDLVQGYLKNRPIEDWIDRVSPEVRAESLKAIDEGAE